MSPTEAKNVNEELHRNYGELFGQPRFRLVWSEDQLEKRVGTVDVFYGHIFINSQTGVHELKKYNYLKERWILEQSSISLNPELLQAIGYEPLFVFQDNKGNYLEPVSKAIAMIISAVLNPTKYSPSSIVDGEQEQMEKEIQFFEDYLSGETSYIASMLANKEAIVVPGGVS